MRMSTPSRALVCDLNAEDLPDIRLAVWESGDDCKWAMVLRSGDVVLAQGAGDSILAAQVDCQLAHAAWLRQKEERFGIKWNGEYNWHHKELH